MDRKLKSLVVDDDPASRALLKKLLQTYGQVEEAENGVQAVIAFRNAIVGKSPHHLVTLDLLMPEMDGIAALECMRGLEHVHQVRPKSKILIMSGANDSAHILSTIRLGCDGYLLKPVDRSLLVGKVRQLLNMPLASGTEPHPGQPSKPYSVVRRTFR